MYVLGLVASCSSGATLSDGSDSSQRLDRGADARPDTAATDRQADLARPDQTKADVVPKCQGLSLAWSGWGAPRAIAGTASNDIFVVGLKGFALHYDGVKWAGMTTGTTESLYGVWAAAPNNVFAVGMNGIVLHYDGIAWSKMSSGTAKAINGVWGAGPKDVFAVGGDNKTGIVVLRYDGTSWTEMATPGGNLELTAVWGSAVTDIYAVGTGFYLHYDGNQWSSSAALGALSAVWGSSFADVFAVGGGGGAYHYNGTDWIIANVNVGFGEALRGVWGTGPADVYAVGMTPGLTPAKSPLFHYDGKGWTKVDTWNVYSLDGVWGTASNNVYAVGSTPDFATSNSMGLVLHYDCALIP